MRFWHPCDSWSSWQLLFFVPSNFCQQGEEADGKAAVFAGALGSLHCQVAFFPPFFFKLVLNMYPFVALLEEISCYNKPGFSYPSNNHSDQLG